MKVSYQYDQDPRYGWASVDIGKDKSALIIVHSDDGGSEGFEYKDGIMIPTCICHALEASECACSNVSWDEDFLED